MTSKWQESTSYLFEVRRVTLLAGDPGTLIVVFFYIADASTGHVVPIDSNQTFICTVSLRGETPERCVNPPSRVSADRIQVVRVHRPEAAVRINDLEVRVTHAIAPRGSKKKPLSAAAAAAATVLEWLPRFDTVIALSIGTLGKNGDTITQLTKHDKGKCILCSNHGHWACKDCLSVCYCSRACQLTHWKLGHKHMCNGSTYVL